jgi:hypothetical protein
MTIFKQYGEERSGTNYLKRLIEINFTDAVVFGSVLGWKHGLFQISNGHHSPSAKDHEDWVIQKRVDGKIFSVDNYPLHYDEQFLVQAARNLNYLISYKPLLPWLASMKRFRFPKREYNEAPVEALFKRYIKNYKTWLGLPNATVVDHDTLIDEAKCTRLLQSLQERHGLELRHSEIVIDKRTVNASTDHGLLLGETTFDGEYYASHRYLNDLPPWVIEMSRQEQFNTQFVEKAAWRPPSAIPTHRKNKTMVKLCTLAIGEKYETLARELQASLPVDIAIYDTARVSGEAVVFSPEKGFNMHCKRVPIEKEYHPEGTLFLEADTTCVNKETFNQFLASLKQFPPGIHAVHAYNAYGAMAPVQEGRFVSGLSAGGIQREKFNRKIAFFSNISRVSEEDLIRTVFPVEWFLFCKFESEQQKDAFFERWKLLESDLLGSDLKALREECYPIGLAATHAKLPVERLHLKVGVNHKSVRTI